MGVLIKLDITNYNLNDLKNHIYNLHQIIHDLQDELREIRKRDNCQQQKLADVEEEIKILKTKVSYNEKFMFSEICPRIKYIPD